MRWNVPPSTRAAVRIVSVLARPGTPSIEQVPACQQADQHALEHLILPGDHALHLEQGGLDRLTAVARGVEADKTALLWHVRSLVVECSRSRLACLRRNSSAFLQKNSGSLEEA